MEKTIQRQIRPLLTLKNLSNFDFYLFNTYKGLIASLLKLLLVLVPTGMENSSNVKCQILPVFFSLYIK